VNVQIEPVVGGPLAYTLAFRIAPGGEAGKIHVASAAYANLHEARDLTPPPEGPPSLIEYRWSLMRTGGWYDFELTRAADAAWKRRYAGRHEIGGGVTTDPAMGGVAAMGWV